MKKNKKKSSVPIKKPEIKEYFVFLRSEPRPKDEGDIYLIKDPHLGLIDRRRWIIMSSSGQYEMILECFRMTAEAIGQMNSAYEQRIQALEKRIHLLEDWLREQS